MDLTTLRNKLRARLPDAITDLRALVEAQHPDALARREAGYQIRNATADEAVVRIYDEIWWLGVNAENFARDLDAVTASKIRVEINSPGGDVFDGIAIYNALRTHPAEVTTRTDGIAASIASVIFQAGDRRIMLGGSQMMIHNAWGMTIGDRRDHDDMSAMLDQQDDIIAGIYAQRSGLDADHFRTLMDAETWMSAERAVEEGLADEVVQPDKGSVQDSKPSLHDEITAAMGVAAEAVAAAERVGALRAEAGKCLSAVNVESLAGLRDVLGRLDDLLTDTTPSDDQIAAEYARFVALTQEIH